MAREGESERDKPVVFFWLGKERKWEGIYSKEFTALKHFLCFFHSLPAARMNERLS